MLVVGYTQDDADFFSALRESLSDLHAAGVRHVVADLGLPADGPVDPAARLSRRTAVAAQALRHKAEDAGWSLDEAPRRGYRPTPGRAPTQGLPHASPADTMRLAEAVATMHGARKGAVLVLAHVDHLQKRTTQYEEGSAVMNLDGFLQWFGISPGAVEVVRRPGAADSVARHTAGVPAVPDIDIAVIGPTPHSRDATAAPQRSPSL